MSFILRIIRKNRWYTDDDYPWLEENEVPADTLGDLVTQNNELSVWSIDDELSNLGRLLAALAANRDKLDKLDYLLFSPEILNQVNIEFQKTDGLLPDIHANDWHISLLNLSAHKASDLATFIWFSPTTQKKRLLKNKIATLLLQSIHEGNIALDQLKPKLRDEIKKRITPPSST